MAKHHSRPLFPNRPKMDAETYSRSPSYRREHGSAKCELVTVRVSSSSGDPTSGVVRATKRGGRAHRGAWISGGGMVHLWKGAARARVLPIARDGSIKTASRPLVVCICYLALLSWTPTLVPPLFQPVVLSICMTFLRSTIARPKLGSRTPSMILRSCQT